MKTRSLAVLVLLFIAAMVAWKLPRPTPDAETAAALENATPPRTGAGNPRGKASSREIPEAPSVYYLFPGKITESL